MRSRVVTLFVLFTLLCEFGCTGSYDDHPFVLVNNTNVPARIKIATANAVGSFYPVGIAIANVLSQHLPGVLAVAETSSGSAHNIRMLDARQIHFGLSNAAITFPALRGLEDFEKPFAVEAVLSIHRSVNLFLSLKESGIRTIKDLKGKRVSVGPPGSGWDYYTKPILEAHGVGFSDFYPTYQDQSSAIEALTDGVIDAVFVGGSVPHSTVRAATASHAIEFLEFDQPTLQRVNITYPFIRPFIIPAHTYRGQDRDLCAVESGLTQLITRSDADAEYIYLIAKTIYENRATIGEMHPAGLEITPETVVIDIGIPYHEGSIRYFHEIGLWDRLSKR